MKNYNKTKPIRIEEFDAEAAWWGNEKNKFKTRVENEYAWQISIEDIKARNYNLDCKNPHLSEQEVHDPDLLLARYQTIQEDISKLREQLKNTLNDALSSNSMKQKEKA